MLNFRFLSNYATKADLKNAIGRGRFTLPQKSDLVSLKVEVDRCKRRNRCRKIKNSSC